jgi:hypothetical protein
MMTDVAASFISVYAVSGAGGVSGLASPLTALHQKQRTH